MGGKKNLQNLPLKCREKQFYSILGGQGTLRKNFLPKTAQHYVKNRFSGNFWRFGINLKIFPPKNLPENWFCSILGCSRAQEKSFLPKTAPVMTRKMIFQHFERLGDQISAQLVLRWICTWNLGTPKCCKTILMTFQGTFRDYYSKIHPWNDGRVNFPPFWKT